jgi:glucose-6-phosphate isomerase
VDIARAFPGRRPGAPLKQVTPASVGQLIALYERAVGLYGSLVNVNAYHQPGVEAGKKAAAAVLSLDGRVRKALGEAQGKALTVEEVARAAGTDDVETVFWILRHLVANPERGVSRILAEGASIFEASYRQRG